MSKTNRKPAAGTSKKPPKAEKKLRPIPESDLGSVTGGGGLDPCNNVMRH